MLSELINPIPILISLTAVFGVLVHDTKFDKAVLTAVTAPESISRYAESSASKFLSANNHIHVEVGSFMSKVGFGSQQPSSQPKSDDDKKYIAQKRLIDNGSGTDYHWPSI